MYDQTYSDTEHNISNDTTQESETDIQLAAESQAIMLREQNNTLLKENSSLRAQFEEALRITKQVEEVHQKNRQLKAAVREYQSKLDNANQRVEISTRTIEELNKKLDDEKFNTQNIREHDQAAMQKEILKIKAQSKANTDELYAQLDEISQAKEKTELDHKMISGKIDRCLENAAHYFQSRFQSFDDFVNFLGQSKVLPTQDQQQAPNQAKYLPITNICNENSNDIVQKLGKRLKRERAKIKEQASLQEELEATISKLKRDQQDMEIRYKQEIDSLKKQFNQKEEDFVLLDADQKHQISALSAKIEALKIENAKRKAEQSTPAPQPVIIQAPQPKPKVQLPSNDQPKPSAKNIEIDLAIEQITQRSEDLSRQLKSVTSQREELILKFRSLESQKKESDSELERIQHEFNSLRIVHNESIAELESLRKALHEKESVCNKKETSKLKHEIRSLKTKIESLNTTIEIQKKQAYEISLQNEQANHTIAQLNQKLSESKRTNEENQRTIENLKDDVATIQQAYNDKPSITQEDVLPPSAWRYPDFGKDLSDLLLKISINPSLQPSSKLQNVYKAILSYYTRIIGERDAAIQDAYSECQSLKYSLNQHLVNTSIALGIEPVTLEYFFSSNGSNSIVSNISNLRSFCDDLKRSNEQINNALNHFCMTLNLPNDGDFLDQANKIKEQICSLNTQLQKRSKKCHEINNAFRTLKKKYEVDIDDLNTQVSQLTEVNANLTKSNAELSESNQQFRRELQTVKTEYRDYKDKKEEHENVSKEKHEDEMQNWQNEKSKLENQIQELVKINTDKELEVKSAISEHERIIERLKKTIHAQKATISEKDEEITRIKQSSEDSINELTSKAEKEKKQLIKSYEKAVQDITDQCNVHRNDVEKMARVLAETEKKLKHTKSNLMQVKRDNLKITSDLQTQKEQNDRDKKLSESTSKTAILNAETNYNTRLDEQKAKFENDKRRIYAFVADTFKQFFNPHENIDERSFKAIVTRTRDELASLIASDLAIRRLVGAASHQKTDDAVAQVLMSNS
ncbi:hypothetical protein TRFO_07956 [Tritrichomonas foetus]|uniref:Uncharacterized protein n=1 Tax=Tritrichomonas foetus TaxID=1144522 RepID=A0A1J4JRZ6_9EUKA|nr:hypothetical protein TRFO_07956 [Tritrichomonas foetus]|eukprot:OHT00302.1 hypothetical protein TRFO_07956 [Tritrichomonas foetus]